MALETSGRVTLADLAIGEKGTILSLDSECKGTERLRLMALGIMPGSQIHAELCSPLGDPIGYRIKGALIGLRCEQARLIQIEPMQ